MKQFAWPVTLSIWGLAFSLISGVLAQDKEPTEKAAAGKEEAEEKLPSAEEVLQNYIKAIGGEAAYKEHQSQHAIGTVDLGAQNMKGKMEVFAARPNRLLVMIEMPGVGEITTGYNGEVGWMSNPLTGPMILPESMLDQVATQADFDHALRKPEDFKILEMLGREEFNGEPCYKLRLVHRTGFESTEFYNEKTGLQTGFISSQASPLGEVKVTTVITDYKKFGDMLMPSKIVQKVSGMEQTMTIEKMEFDTVPASKFELPEEVKTLTEPVEPAAESTEN